MTAIPFHEFPTRARARLMRGMPNGFEYVRRGEDIVIFHHGKKATVLRGDRVTQFDKDSSTRTSSTSTRRS